MLPGGKKLPGFLHWAVKRRQLAIDHISASIEGAFRARNGEKRPCRAKEYENKASVIAML